MMDVKINPSIVFIDVLPDCCEICLTSNEETGHNEKPNALRIPWAHSKPQVSFQR
ncbi:hypothetical protein M404DRAFT_995326 [Pisolithus tinctorius Marx 270]|uniref:Uncharacterized protein n=1 Tax=Pisolithus tinctorius Marx 270 TaxID=870435 RepID=A0A0C3PQS3_PISTI|nr:hypothetical protein M404DRAFT_995326 [Pisolithus tinctorius Marx 270]